MSDIVELLKYNIKWCAWESHSQLGCPECDRDRAAITEIERLRAFINDLDIQVMHPDMGGNHQCSIRANGRTLTSAQWDIVMTARYGGGE